MSIQTSFINGQKMAFFILTIDNCQKCFTLYAKMAYGRTTRGGKKVSPFADL